jgi:hypothetical protein
MQELCVGVTSRGVLMVVIGDSFSHFLSHKVQRVTSLSTRHYRLPNLIAHSRHSY